MTIRLLQDLTLVAVTMAMHVRGVAMGTVAMKTVAMETVAMETVAMETFAVLSLSNRFFLDA